MMNDSETLFRDVRRQILELKSIHTEAALREIDVTIDRVIENIQING
ncbi:hypothetical protein Cha6605_4581 [Chamaesiphon minutus PCC 6605]|uniref:Uncharacterized protein n=1 Tax=Chamaesiphon minutus (strain ATCC 27169 / PCC 6605) TaxID=1173020 RepID=K9UKZ1_CHAP6|nr:hypothetical protein Cha6605_4581 [Chamaesiphon minutus PCC 6605]